MNRPAETPQPCECMNMKRVLSGFLSLAAWTLLSGGCPLPQANIDSLSGSTGNSSSSSSSSNGSGPAGDGSGGGSGGGGSTSGSGTTDDLATQFPGCQDFAEAAAWRTRIIDLVNQERTSRGLGAVTYNAMLEAQASDYACEMIVGNFFDHVSPVTGSTLGDRAVQFGYDYQIIGENLAAGQTSPEQVMQEWMASEHHRDNILNPQFIELGVGIRRGGSYGTYWVQEFGLPLAAP